MNIRQTPDAAGIVAGLDAVERQLGKYGLKKKEIMKARLISEELVLAKSENLLDMDAYEKRS